MKYPVDDKEQAIRLLAEALKLAVVADQDYDNRYGFVLQAVALANIARYKAGFRIDPMEPNWPVAYIELPDQGQIAWHIPAYPDPWDGHTTEEKMERIAIWISGIPSIRRCYGCGEDMESPPEIIVGDQEFCSEACHDRWAGVS